jgi:hypothetical protein
MSLKLSTGLFALGMAVLMAGPLGHAAEEPRPLGARSVRPAPLPKRLLPTENAWSLDVGTAIRGITLGPIESSLHPNHGYGSPAYQSALDEARELGANWVSLTVFGRVWDNDSTGISLSFEAPYRENRENVRRAIAQAHARGLRVLLVPHLWIESGEWRAELDPPGDEGWNKRAQSYRNFLMEWAQLAAETDVDMLAVGVELRSWVTTTHAPTFLPLVADVRKIYPGLLTYAANWDDVEDTSILGELDVIGINAFYPLAEKENASIDELRNGAERVATRVEELARRWERPVMFTEFGYTTRPDPALRPWEWPDSMQNVRVDQKAQADAYRALLGAMLDARGFAGLFVWRMYADPADMSQEAEWGFSPRGKQAERVVRDAFSARWGADRDPVLGDRPLAPPL